MQLTDTLLLVRPAAFAFNSETAANNYFQSIPNGDEHAIKERAISEFDAMVGQLRAHDIRVIVEQDSETPPKPDAVFPNNWMMADSRGMISLFPMFAPNRRTEKRGDIIQRLQQQFVVHDVQDWSAYEAEGSYLEGTGSMVMDHRSRIIYAALSGRTHPGLLEKYAATIGYRAMAFEAHDPQGRPVYHTNVVLSIGEGFAVLCPKAITDHTERIAVSQLLEATGHEMIYIETELLMHFGANLLQVKNIRGEKLIIISRRAADHYPQQKLEMLSRHGKLVPVEVPTIESVNGGSVRCMVAEIFLQPKKDHGAI